MRQSPTESIAQNRATAANSPLTARQRIGNVTPSLRRRDIARKGAWCRREGAAEER
ncbi:MAG: hypothetical protein AB8B36_09640 [Prochlorococcus sp.]